MKTPTPRQKKAAIALFNNATSDKPVPVGEVLANVGYGTIVQDPKRITESIGFKKALNDLGLSETLITESLVEDIKEKKGNRLGELRLGAEMLGMNKREDEPIKPISGNTYNFIFSEEVQSEVRRMEESIKAKLIQKHVQAD